MLPIYILIIPLLALITARTAAVARLLDVPSLLASGIIAAGIIYISCLIPGALGLFYTPVVYLMFILLSVAFLLLLDRLTKASTRQCDLESCVNAALTPPELILLGLGLLGAVPLLTHFRWVFPATLRNPNAILGWDTVSYHLPAFVEFWQKHSFWSLDGPCQSYSFAFELIGNFLSHPFFAHWGLVLANAFAVGLLVTSIATVARRLTPFLPSNKVVSWIPCAALAIGIWTSIYPDEVADIGKNDIFMTACLMATLCFILEILAFADNGDVRIRRPCLLFLASIALGLALGTKPSALAFVPFFAVAAGGVTVRLANTRGALNRQVIMNAGIVLSVSLVLGGFWLARNLVAFGSLSPLEGAWKLSLVANLANPALYEIKRGSILFGAGVLATIPGLFLIADCRRRPEALLSMALLVAFHVVGCCAFAITPHAIFHHDLSESYWKLRLGMPLFVSAALIYSLAATRLCSLVSRLRSPIKVALTSVLSVAMMVGLQLHWSATQRTGLPGYDRVKGLPHTGVYDWVQTQTSPLRIYSAGLRPYGLYGQVWINTLFYDLHSTSLAPLESGITRISVIVVRFHPDLIIVSVDPHPYSGTSEKPAIVDWMRTQSRCFEEVYSDETVSVFSVKAGADVQLSNHIPSDYHLAMGI